MDPNKWGPHMWNLLHTITINYPANPTLIDIQNHQMFLESIKYIIPCEMCRKHHTITISKFPPKLDSRMEFIKWMIDLHNVVNKQNNKQVYSHDEAMVLINDNISKSHQIITESSFNYLKYVVVILILFVIVICFVFVYNKSPKRKVIRY